MILNPQMTPILADEKRNNRRNPRTTMTEREGLYAESWKPQS